MMDVERSFALLIQRATDLPCRLDVPAERPEEFITMTLSATDADCFKRSVRLTVQSWAKTRKRAQEIASLVETCCSAFEEEVNIFSCVPDGTYRWDDPETNTPRYQTNVNIQICE